jgi:hypothetical protein
MVENVEGVEEDPQGEFDLTFRLFDPLDSSTLSTREGLAHALTD